MCPECPPKRVSPGELQPDELRRAVAALHRSLVEHRRALAQISAGTDPLLRLPLVPRECENTVFCVVHAENAVRAAEADAVEDEP